MLAALDKGYKWKSAGGEVFRLNRMRLLISNYRPHEVDDRVRQELGDRLRGWPPNDILIDIRPGRPGGEIPMTGQVTLRSFNSVLEFVAMGWRQGTGQDSDSLRLLTIEETESELENAAVSVRYGDRYYGIRRMALLIIEFFTYAHLYLELLDNLSVRNHAMDATSSINELHR